MTYAFDHIRLKGSAADPTGVGPVHADGRRRPDLVYGAAVRSADGADSQRGPQDPVVTRSRARVAAHVEARARAGDDPFDPYPPPFDVESDLLLVAGTCPVGPLLRTFPDVPFRSFGSRALMGAWFARVDRIRAGPGGRTSIGPTEAPGDLPYGELNVAILLRGRRLFVPGIYATSDLTLALGHRYGMPKGPVRMTYETRGRVVTSQVHGRGAEARVTARSVPLGRYLGPLVSSALPRWSWPVLFPSGSRIEALLERADGARLVRLREGLLALNEPWLPEPASLWRTGLHVPRQSMHLPDPRPRTRGTNVGR